LQAAGLARIAIFVDYDNVKGHSTARLTPSQIMDAIRCDLGPECIVQVEKLYLPMGMPDDHSPLDRDDIFKAFAHGAEPVTVPSFRGSGTLGIKNIADPTAIVDIVKCIFTHPEIPYYVIVTGDKDFLPAVRELRKNGKGVRIYYRVDCADILMSEVEWIKGDGFSATINIEEILGRTGTHYGRGNAV
jgi:uncharacterized LabA/DUF88 family protein